MKTKYQDNYAIKIDDIHAKIRNDKIKARLTFIFVLCLISFLIWLLFPIESHAAQSPRVKLKREYIQLKCILKNTPKFCIKRLNKPSKTN